MQLKIYSDLNEIQQGKAIHYFRIMLSATIRQIDPELIKQSNVEDLALISATEAVYGFNERGLFYLEPILIDAD